LDSITITVEAIVIRLSVINGLTGIVVALVMSGRKATALAVPHVITAIVISLGCRIHRA